MDRSFDSANRHQGLTDSIATAPLLPTSTPRVRNAPRRRFLYGWNTRSTVRQMLADSVKRLRYLDCFAPLDTCPPLQPCNQVVLPLVKAARLQPLRQVRYGVDESMLASIAAEPAIPGGHEPLRVMAPGVVEGLAVVKPVWAQAERSLSSLKANARGCDGLYVPQVAVSTLQVGFTMGKAPVETIGGNSDRRAVVIPFQELAAAAVPSKEKATVLPMRRLS